MLLPDKNYKLIGFKIAFVVSQRFEITQWRNRSKKFSAYELIKDVPRALSLNNQKAWGKSFSFDVHDFLLGLYLLWSSAPW